MNRLLLALSASAIFSTNVMAADAASCQNVRMGVVNWTDVIATSAMTQVLLDGLGYKTKQTSASQQIIFAGIRDQRLDLFLGYWNPLMTQTITPFVDAKQVKVLDKPSRARCRRSCRPVLSGTWRCRRRFSGPCQRGRSARRGWRGRP